MVDLGAVSSPEALRELVEHGDAHDRAYVDAMIRMAWTRTTDRGERHELEELHAAVCGASLRAHSAVRTAIATQALRGDALRLLFEDAPSLERDHFVEEILGIAYPPLEEPVLGPELIAYTPSGYDEIVHAFDLTRLGTGDRFVDIGSGTGKVVMLAELLHGADGVGVDCNASLVDIAVQASADLGGRARFQHGDARDVPIEDADVVFMYLPFTGSVLSGVMTRLMDQHRGVGPARPYGRFLCAGALDLTRYEDLVAVGTPKSWLQVYRWR
jgi:hypothetical protein